MSSDCVAEFAKLHGLTVEELETIAELAPFVSREKGSAPVTLPDTCYRTLYEEAETRYNRMKALMCASLEAQMRIRSRWEGKLVVKTLRELGLGDDEEVDAILGQRSMTESSRRKLVSELFALSSELKSVREENARLEEMNRRLRGEQSEVFADDEVDPRGAISDAVELAVTRERAFVLELELNRLNDFRFEDEQRLREWQSALDASDPPTESGPLPKRFHPVPVCSDYRCQAFLQRLRSGIRQSVADAFIRDRVARINGFFRRTVEPVERVRAEKDRDISALRLRLKRLEQAACMTSAEAEAVQLDERIVEMRLRAEDLRSEGARLGHEVAELKVGGLKFGSVASCLIIVCFQAERDRIRAVLDSLRADEEEMRKMLEGQRAVKAQVELALEIFEKQKRDVDFYMRRMEKYENGDLARDVEAKYRESNRLYEEIAVLEERKYRLEHGIAESEDDDEEEEDTKMEVIAEEEEDAAEKRAKK